MEIEETPLMDIAKEENQYCFDDGVKRVEDTISEFGLSRKIVGSLAAQLSDAFEAGYAAGVFDTMAIMRMRGGTGSSEFN